MSDQSVDRSLDDLTPAEPRQPTPGALLKAAREALDIPTIQVAEKLHISNQLVHEIEQNNFDNITAKIYLKGYLQHYAEMVHVSAEKVLAALDNVDWQPPVRTQKPMTLQLPRYFDKKSKFGKKKKTLLWFIVLIALTLGVLFFYSNIEKNGGDVITKPTTSTVKTDQGVALNITTARNN